jgi:hypothetical protein
MREEKKQATQQTEAEQGKGIKTTGELRAFGLSLLTDAAAQPPGAWEPRPFGEPSLQLRSATPKAIENSWSGVKALGWEAMIDGARFSVEEGQAGDHLFVHAHRSSHHLSADGTLLQCSSVSLDDPLSWRIVLDSVLFTVAQIVGYEALHAATYVGPAGAVAITAGSGGGKSTLLATLLSRGYPLLADDITVLGPPSTHGPHPPGPLLAQPAPPVMNLPMQADLGLGSVIARAGEENWTAVATHAEAVPLDSLVLLERRAGLTTDLHRPDQPLALLMKALLPFPRSEERTRARFEMASQLCDQTSIWVLTADPSTEPGVLADLLPSVSAAT